MKRAIIKEVDHNTRLMSYGKQLHNLTKEGAAAVGNVQFERWAAKKSQAFENNIRFDVATEKDSIILIDDASKALRAHSLSKFLDHTH